MSEVAAFKDDPMLDIEITNSNQSAPTNMQVEASTKPQPTPVKDKFEERVFLEGHEGEVICGASHTSNPSVFATGSTDCITRIWTMPNNPADQLKCRELKIPTAPDDASGENSSDPSLEVTCMAWDPSGKSLAIGYKSGHIRLYSYQPTSLLFTVHRHESAITCIEWNKRGDVFVSGSADTTVIAWDGKSCEVRQVFEFHTDAVTALAWQDNITFATSSVDRDVFICQMGSPVPLKQCEGHLDGVKCLGWDNRGEILVSGGDEGDMRAWKLDSSVCVNVYKSHKACVTAICWAKESSGGSSAAMNGSGQSASGEDTRMFLSSSLDGTVKLWNTSSTTPVFSFDMTSSPLLSAMYPGALSQSGKKGGVVGFGVSSAVFLMNGNAVLGLASTAGTIHIVQRNSSKKPIVKEYRLAGVPNGIETGMDGQNDVVNGLYVSSNGEMLYGVLKDKRAVAIYLSRLI